MNVAGFKNTFFDRAAVADKIPPAVRQALSKFGAFVRRRARTSLKYGPGRSGPGRVPVVHRSKGFTRRKKVKGAVTAQPASPLRELIFFGFDPARQSVVIGPAVGGSRTGAPAALEYGGASVVLRAGRRTVGRYAARPFMRPAFAAEMPGAGDDFKGLIR